MPIKYQEREGFRGETEIVIIKTVAPNEEAMLAAELLRHLAICTGEPDGEDSAGRTKLKLLDPAACAKRACEIAHHALAEFKTRGWLLDLPDPKLPRPREEKKD